MPKLVGIFNTPPVYALGLAGALADSDYRVESVADPVPWLRRNKGAPVLVGIHDRADLEMVVELKTEEPDSVVVTILDHLDVDAVHASLQAGATGSVDLAAPPEEVRLTLSAALAERTVLPTRLVRRLAGNGEGHTSPVTVGPDEVSWLRALADGQTVVVLGRRLGYSEREMYRRLRRLYARMGASNRTDALLRAARWGLLD